MNLTTLFRLRKPEGTDPVDVKDFNDNFDVIDAELGKRPEKTGNASDMVTAFSQAGSRTNLTSGEKLSVSMGKIMKWFADLKTVAFTGNYSDLSGKPSIPSGAAASKGVANNCTTTADGYVLDARQGKTLMDKANQIISDLGRVNVYVGSDGKLHYVNKDGADSALPFNPFNGCVITVNFTLSVTTRSGNTVTSTSGSMIINVSKEGSITSNASEFKTGNSSIESYSVGHFYITGLSVQFL